MISYADGTCDARKFPFLRKQLQLCLRFLRLRWDCPNERQYPCSIRSLTAPANAQALRELADVAGTNDAVEYCVCALILPTKTVLANKKSCPEKDRTGASVVTGCLSLMLRDSGLWPSLLFWWWRCWWIFGKDDVCHFWWRPHWSGDLLPYPLVRKATC